MAMPRSAFHRPLCSLAELKQCSGTTSTTEGAWRWRRSAMVCDPSPFLGFALRLRIGGSGDGFREHPAGVLRVRCASKSAMRVLQEVVSVSGSNGAMLLVRRSRGLSRVAQMEVLEELVQRGRCELVLAVSDQLLVLLVVLLMCYGACACQFLLPFSAPMSNAPSPGKCFSFSLFFVQYDETFLRTECSLAILLVLDCILAFHSNSCRGVLGILQMYEAVRKGARYKWDANLHARIVAMVSKEKETFADSAHILEPEETLAPKQKAVLECALIESYISHGLVNQAHEAFHRLCGLPLAKCRSLGYRALVRAYSAAEKPIEAENMLMELKSLGCPPSVDDYKALLLGFGKLGMLTDMERIADDLRKKGMKLDTAGFNILISAYCYAGMLDRMVEVFLQMDVAGVRPSLVTWNSLTKACPTLVPVGLEGAGALASPQILCSRYDFLLGATLAFGHVFYFFQLSYFWDRLYRVMCYGDNDHVV